MGATNFLQLTSARYQHGSIFTTSSKSYGDWGTIFGDPISAPAVLNRLLHHSTTVNIRGDGCHLKGAIRDRSPTSWALEASEGQFVPLSEAEIESQRVGGAWSGFSSRGKLTTDSRLQRARTSRCLRTLAEQPRY